MDETPTSIWTAEEIDILETVFRYQFENNASSASATRQVRYLFIGLGEQNDLADPPAELLVRFADHSPPVAPVSLADTSGPGVRHRGDGERGIILRVEGLKRIDADAVEVDGGYYEADRSASGDTYHVERRDGVWVVAGDSMWWIS